MEWAPGVALGPYVLVARIGAGGMGEVWKAQDTRLARHVAIKRLLGAHTHRFAQEARAISALNHPNICQIYDVGPDYLVLEYIEGDTARGPMAPEAVARLAVQIASALEEAHARGILHRDLKPANILINASGTPKLLDFGVAKLLAAEGDATLTGEGTVVGTAAYMSPEQAEGQPLDARSDIFSFGAVLYELLSGARAFAGETAAQVISAVLRAEPPPLQTDAALQRIVRRCLRRNPSDRFRTATELRDAVESFRGPTKVNAPSVAVLPFANMSADPENAYFSDGLAEDIINALAQIPGLKVTARTSAFAFRDKAQDIRAIAETLDVGTILEGSVRRAGSRVRVTAQLIDASDGYHLWSERFDRELADIFAVQDEITAAIVQALQGALAPERLAQRRYAPNVASYEAYLRAVHETQKLTPEGMAQARGWFEQAIALDSQFALAHSMYGFLHALLANYSIVPAHEAMPRARSEAQRALAIDPSLPDAHAMLGVVAAIYDYDWTGAQREFALAMAEEPVPAQVRRHYALYYLLPVGRCDEAVEECRRGLEDDPLNLLARVRYAQCLQAADRDQDAFAELRRILELDDTVWFIPFILGLHEMEVGRVREALVLAERAATLAPWNHSARGLLAAACDLNGHTARAEELLAKLRPGDVYGTPLGLATFNLARGDVDGAASWMERVAAERHPAIFFSLRAHARVLLRSARWPGLAKLLNLPIARPG